MTADRKLPAGWRMVRFGDVVRNVKETVDPEESGLERYIAGEHMDTDDLHIRRWGIIGDGYLGPAFHRKFSAGQVLYGSRRTYLRKVAIPGFDGVTSNTTFVLEPADDRLLPELLPFVMSTEPFHDHSIKQSKGSVNPYINWKDLAWYEFALPPLEEQRRIAEVLWMADSVSESIQSAIAAHETARLTTLRQFFETRDWEKVPLGTAGQWVSGGTPARSKKEYWNGSIPWVSPKDMKIDVITSTIESVSEAGARSGTRIVPTDSIFVVVRGMILAHTFPVAIAGCPVAFNQDIRALIPSQEYRPWFLFYWFQHSAQRCLGIVADSSHGTKRIPSDALFALEVPKPPLEEQDELIHVMQAHDAAAGHLLRHEQQSRGVSRGLMADLFQGGARV